MMQLMNPRVVLKQYWGYEDFRPGQLPIVESICQGRDTLAVLATGGGKSICYQVPGLCREGLVVVITPLISLMQDQVGRLLRQGVAAVAINSALEPRERKQALEDIYAGRTKFLYLSPELLSANWMAKLLAQLRIALVAVDEAHCISVWGQDFRPSYKQIATSLQKFRRTAFPIAAFTATATPRVRAEIAKSLRLQAPQIFTNSFARKNIKLSVHKALQPEVWRRKILTATQSGAVIVYASSRRRTEELAAEYGQLGVRASYYHAGLGSAERARIQEDFIADEYQLIAATNAFGMGVDKPNVRTVFHDSIPDSLENYFQEVGRAGRDGEPSAAHLQLSWKGINTRSRMLEDSYLTPQLANLVYNYLCRAPAGLKLSEILLDLTNINKAKLKYCLEQFARAGILEYEITGENTDNLQIKKLNSQIIFLARHINFRQKRQLFELGRQRLKKLIGYCITEDCRMSTLVKYFGEELPACGQCDNCLI
jgi:ATP-dependent DNA helicase RecQ